MNESEKAEEKKMGIDETLDCMEFAESCVNQLADHKADDGKIDTSEWLQTGASLAPSLVEAVVGITSIDDELKDLDQEELKILAAKGVAITRGIIKLVMP